MKFCYADIHSDRNIDEMFEYYKSTLKDLRRRFPNVTFVHVTVPVTMRSVWWKRLFRNVTGKEDPWDLGSTNRYRYNEKLLAEYGGEPIFDLAKVESTRPDGTRESFEYGGMRAYSLLEEYTYDGGHLNEYGRKIVAREFIRTIASVLRNMKGEGQR